mmetsp:Transcript_15120/g.19360  ORF Transcript_15120/g.19360 Transcript_15120/m.19360 type:complete len:127 (+) Transcript_15120:620-1000(+)
MGGMLISAELRVCRIIFVGLEMVVATPIPYKHSDQKEELRIQFPPKARCFKSFFMRLEKLHLAEQQATMLVILKLQLSFRMILLQLPTQKLETGLPKWRKKTLFLMSAAPATPFSCNFDCQESIQK